VVARLTEFIRRLSAPAEFCVVLVGCSWFSLFGSVADVVTQSWKDPSRANLTDGTAIALVLFELLSLALLWWIGRVRGWQFATWGLQPSWRRVGGGALLWFGAGIAVAIIGLLANAVSPGVAAHPHLQVELSTGFVALIVAINPIFEELLETGYFIHALQRYGMWVAVLASAVFRAFLHAYQGIGAVISIFPLGLIFALVYWKWRSLWPLFIAHLIFDVAALMALR
jgi:membrane protease YdiL (CAAX protease family)